MIGIGKRCTRCEAETSLYRWPPGTVVTWAVDEPTVPPTIAGFVYLSAVNGISPWMLTSAAEIQFVEDVALARVVIRFGPIDGPSGVLGETQEPAEGRADVQHVMLLDASEPWTPQYLTDVIRHEFGHGLGLVHPPEGTIATMAAYYDGTVHVLCTWDVREVQLRYPLGARAAPPDGAQVNQKFVITISDPGSYVIDVTSDGDASVKVYALPSSLPIEAHT